MRLPNKPTKTQWLAICEAETQEYLEAVGARPSCSWCKNPDTKVYCKGLCRHCYRINLKLSKMKSFIKQAGNPVPSALDYDMRVLRKWRDLAQKEGRRYGGIHKQKVDDLRLENAFSDLGNLLGRQGHFLFHGYNSFLAMAFPSPVQKRFLFYLLSRLLRRSGRRLWLSHAGWELFLGRDREI